MLHGYRTPLKFDQDEENREIGADHKMKAFLYKLLSLLGICQIGRFAHRRRALILTYHGVVRDQGNSYENRNCVEITMFDQQMAYLSRHYKVISLAKLVERLSRGEQLPPYTAVITFDDGFRNNFAVALPILRKYHLPATIFLATSFIGSDTLGLWTEHVDSLIHRTVADRIQLTLQGNKQSLPLRTPADRDRASDLARAYLKTLPPAERDAVMVELRVQMEESIDGRELQKDDGLNCRKASDLEKEERYAFLSWAEVQLMTRESVTFGSHTHTHAILTPLSEADLHFELTESRRLIEEHLGQNCAIFSYPNGTMRDFGRREENVLRELGYRAAVSQIDGFNDASTDLMALRRINIPRDESFDFFMAKVSGIWSVLKKFEETLSFVVGTGRGEEVWKVATGSPNNRRAE